MNNHSKIYKKTCLNLVTILEINLIPKICQIRIKSTNKNMRKNLKKISNNLTLAYKLLKNLNNLEALTSKNKNIQNLTNNLKI